MAYVFTAIWQPIETAPKGPRILATDGDIVSVTRYEPMGLHNWICEAETTDDGYGWSGHDRWTPSHWMPLPEPPK